VSSHYVVARDYGGVKRTHVSEAVTANTAT